MKTVVGYVTVVFLAKCVLGQLADTENQASHHDENHPLPSSLEAIKARDEMLQDILFQSDPVISDSDIRLEDFLWTGSGDEDPDYSDSSAETSFTEVYPSHQTQAGPDGQFHTFLGQKLPEDKFLIRTVVLSNMTTISSGIEVFKNEMENKLTKAYSSAYGRKSRRKRSIADSSLRRFLRSTPEEGIEEKVGDISPKVVIHNIRSSLPKPEIEMIYSVSKDNEFVPAETAVKTLDKVKDEEVEDILGFPILTKAEPYKARAQALRLPESGSDSAKSASAMTSWLIVAVVISTCIAVAVLVALLFLVHKYRLEETRHRRLMTSPGGSSASGQDNASHVSADSSTLDPSAYALAKPGPLEKNLLNDQGTTILTNETFKGQGSDSKDEAPKIALTKSELISSGEDLFKPKESHSRNSSRTGEESPSLADLSSNNTPETQKRSRKISKKFQHRPHKKSKKVGGCPAVDSPSMDVDQSVFPVRTPDKEGFLGPLSDLLEEEINLPGDSRETSAKHGKNWAYLPKNRSSPTTSTSSTSSSCTSLREPAESSVFVLSPCDNRDEPEESSTGAERKPISTLSPTDPVSPDLQTRAISAKSHIFRKGKVDTTRPAAMRAIASSQPRPWSAHESRLQADPIFSMRQRHWEGLISGKKKLHRGQLLPGSTSEEELKEQLRGQQEEQERPSKPQTCWSECTSPRKQVRIQEPLPVMDRSSDSNDDPSRPIIQAIRQELQKFQRPKSPNLTGITVINDPELLKRESDA